MRHTTTDLLRLFHKKHKRPPTLIELLEIRQLLKPIVTAHPEWNKIDKDKDDSESDKDNG